MCGKNNNNQKVSQSGGYIALMVKADPDYRPIYKTWYSLRENRFYYEISIYPERKGKGHHGD